MSLTSTIPRTWVPVATLLTTLMFGCDGADGESSTRESEFARRTAAGDAGVSDSTDDGAPSLDGSVVSVDAGTAAPLDGAAPTTPDDESDAAVQLTDNQIFGILGVYNDAELSAAAAGEGKLEDPATVAFASGVARSANVASTRHSLLATVLDLSPEATEQSAERARIAVDIDTMLESEEPSDSLDLRYAFGEAMTNQALVDLIDETLLPQADSELLKSELRTTRETAKRRVTDSGALVTALSPSVTPEPADPAEPEL